MQCNEYEIQNIWITHSMENDSTVMNRNSVKNRLLHNYRWTQWPDPYMVALKNKQKQVIIFIGQNERVLLPTYNFSQHGIKAKMWEETQQLVPQSWQKHLKSHSSFVTEIPRETTGLVVGKGCTVFDGSARQFIKLKQKPAESCRHDGAAVCDCRTLSEPSADGSDVEPRLRLNFSYFSPQRCSRVGTVTCCFCSCHYVNFLLFFFSFFFQNRWMQTMLLQ